jgi:hypothetical protein
MAGAVIACDWFVMGVERMGVYLVTSVGARAATLALILVFVHQPGDASAAGIISGLGGAFAGAAGWIAVTRLYPMGRPSLDWRRGLEQVWDFRHYFISRSNALLYASAAPVLLGLAASPAALGVYAGADRIVRVCIMVVTPLSIALAARVNAAMAASRRAAGAISGRVVLVYLALTIPMSVLLLLFAEHIAVLVLGEHFRSAGGIIRLLAPLPVLMALSSSLASQFPCRSAGPGPCRGSPSSPASSTWSPWWRLGSWRERPGRPCPTSWPRSAWSPASASCSCATTGRIWPWRSATRSVRPGRGPPTGPSARLRPGWSRSARRRRAAR